MSVWAIVVAAGRGRRFGGPKQFELLEGRTVLDRSLETARSVCDGVVVVVPDGARGDLLPEAGHGLRVVCGGPDRSASVEAGLGALPDDAEVVVVHDAARPLARRELFVKVIAAVRAGADAAVPGIEPPDTVKVRTPGGGVETLPRDSLVLAQTPQAFKVTALRGAHAGASGATDDAALVEQRGGSVSLVEGDRTNIKITEASDLAVASALMAR